VEQYSHPAVLMVVVEHAMTMVIAIIMHSVGIMFVDLVMVSGAVQTAAYPVIVITMDHLSLVMEAVAVILATMALPATMKRIIM
jgi:hypothetical protein